MRVVKEDANAKINLYLDVVSLRDDGFHGIKSIMHSVSFCDKLTVKYSPSKVTNIRLFISGNKYLPTDAKNLAYRAARLFLDKSGISADIEIHIEKKIPVAAGLAGGSADAAAVLRAMNRLSGRIFSDKAILEMGAELGSDIPFCIQRKTALCEGRGEIMMNLMVSPNAHFVIACPSVHISTPSAYHRLDELYSSFDGSIKSQGEEHFDILEKGLKQGKIAPQGIFNIFETAVLPISEKSVEIKKLLLESGASASLMSGSGPSVFGIFDDKATAEAAAELLKSHGINAHYAYSVN